MASIRDTLTKLLASDKPEPGTPLARAVGQYPFQQGEAPLEAPMFSPDDLIGTGIGKAALVGGAKYVPLLMGGIKEVLPQLSKMQKERLIQAADLVPNLEKQYTDKALLQAFEGDRVSNKGNLFSVIKPEEFTQKYAHPLSSEPSGFSRMYMDIKQFDNAITPPTHEVYQKHLANVLRKVGGFNNVPYLELGVKKGLPEMGGNDLLKITGHEGRNRTTALAKRGDENTLVEIIPSYSMTSSEKYGTPSDWIYGDEANKHYLDTIQKYFGGLNPKVINQPGNATFNLPIF